MSTTFLWWFCLGWSVVNAGVGILNLHNARRNHRVAKDVEANMRSLLAIARRMHIRSMVESMVRAWRP